MTKTRPTGPAEEDPGHPSADQTARHPDDQVLRAAGFRIHSRTKQGPATWSRGGRIYEQQLAEAVAARHAAEAAAKPKVLPEAM